MSRISSIKRVLKPHTFTDPHKLRNSSFTSTSNPQVYKLPDMPYDYGALEPTISGQIMEIHHKKHHQTYVNNLNAALEKYAVAEAKRDVATMIGLQGAIKFNGGGHVNHSIFWTNLAPKKNGGGVLPTGELATKIEKQWGSLKNFIEKFNNDATAVQGSGWGWLGYNKATDNLHIITCPNQDPITTVMGSSLTPLLGIDVWEHAYYLQYKNARADYLKAIWEVINWKNVTERLEAAKKV